MFECKRTAIHVPLYGCSLDVDRGEVRPSAQSAVAIFLPATAMAWYVTIL